MNEVLQPVKQLGVSRDEDVSGLLGVFYREGVAALYGLHERSGLFGAFGKETIRSHNADRVARGNSEVLVLEGSIGAPLHLGEHVLPTHNGEGEIYRTLIERIVYAGVEDDVVELSSATVSCHNGARDRSPDRVTEPAERLPIEVPRAGDVVPVGAENDDPGFTLHHLEHRGDLVALSPRNLDPGLLADSKICRAGRNLFDRGGAPQWQDFDVDSGLGEITLVLRHD